MLSDIDLTHCPVPQRLMLSKHVSYLRMIRIVDIYLNGVSCNRLFFHLAVFCLTGVREMFVDGFNVFNIDVALF